MLIYVDNRGLSLKLIRHKHIGRDDPNLVKAEGFRGPQVYESVPCLVFKWSIARLIP